MVAACTGHRDARGFLDRMDSLADECPDSVLAQLDNNRPDFDDLPESILMRYGLLRAKAQNKAFISFTSDSTMKRVSEWYECHGNRHERMEVSYLLGCVYRDLNDAPTALEYYKKAVELADTTSADCDWYTLCRIHGQMADLFNRMASPMYELEEENLAIATAWKAKDTIMALRSYELKADAYYQLYNEDSVISITENVVDKYLQYGRKDLAAGALPTIIYVYLNQKKFDKARECMDYFEQNSSSFNDNGEIEEGKELYYDIKVKYYLGIGKKDSAFIYAQKLLEFKDNIMCAEAAYQGLMNYYGESGQADSVIKYAELFCQMNDSSSIVRSAEEINRTQALYNYSHIQQQMKEKAEEAGRYRMTLICLSFGLLTASLIIYNIYHVQKRKQRKEQAERNSGYAELMSKYSKAADDFQQAASDFEKYKKDKEEELKTLKASIAIYQEDMSHTEVLDADQNLKSSKIAIRLHSLAARGNGATTAELNAMTQLIEIASPDFYKAINAPEAGLSEREKCVCILIRLYFIPTEMATLLDLSTQSITNIRSRINKKLFNTDGTKSLDFRLRLLK